VKAGNGPARVGSVLQDVLEKHGVDKQIARLGVLDLWPEIVGRQLAEVTRVRGVDDAALFVEVRSSAWLAELSMMKDIFLGRVNERLGEAPIERIVFVLAETT
jgi:predicted nucleic acid-binding Zn ribbon protein